MSVEKMIMVNLVGRLDEIDRIVKNIIILGSMHIVSAMEEINTTDFTVRVSEENKEVLMELNYVKPFVNTRDYDALKKKSERVKLMCRDLPGFDEVKGEELILDFEELNIRLDEVLYKFEGVITEYSLKKTEKEKYKTALEHFKLMPELDVPVEELFNMKNFSASLLKISAENMDKLDHNSENIPAIFFSLSKSAEYETIMVVVPNDFKPETDRIFKSLNCEEVSLEREYKGRPSEIIDCIESKSEVLNDELLKLKKHLEKVAEESKKDIGIVLGSTALEMKSEILKNNVVYSEDFFYLFGWVPESGLKHFEDRMKIFENKMITIEKNTEETYQKIVPPTKLKNNIIFRPFESMVNMYGIPSYGEIDPTAFLGLSYMILFGAMFGDVGQGMLLFFGGILLKRFKGKINFGEIISRLGLASTLFGFVYGSVFGFETVIKPLVIRPMENIMQILIYAVALGLILLIMCFIFNMINSIKRKDLENGLFGKDGAAGLALYISVLTFALSKYRGVQLMPGILWIVVFATPLSMILLKEPLVNIIKKRHPLFSGSKQDYFVEGGFGIIEIALSMFTNTLSFIRIGAFALTHVGLFLAFSILASMTQNRVISVIVYIIGNIVIIGLEGLIVFIQGLRLEYYELFSKYYEGYGIAFQPVKLDKTEK